MDNGQAILGGTGAAEEMIPLNEYPRPQFMRPEWLNLNGIWAFGVCPSDREPETLEERILVPFSPEAALSGAEHAPGTSFCLSVSLPILSRLPAETGIPLILIHSTDRQRSRFLHLNAHQQTIHPENADKDGPMFQSPAIALCHWLLHSSVRFPADSAAKTGSSSCRG